MKRGITLKVGTHALLNDGRRFQVKEIKQVYAFEDGTISDSFQSIIVSIDGTNYEMSINELARNINYSSVW